MAFINQGEFEAMKTLSGWEAVRSDEHQFCAKIKVSTLAVFELSLLDKWSNEKWHFCLLSHTFAFSCLLRGF